MLRREDGPGEFPLGSDWEGKGKGSKAKAKNLTTGVLVGFFDFPASLLLFSGSFFFFLPCTHGDNLETDESKGSTDYTLKRP